MLLIKGLLRFILVAGLIIGLLILYGIAYQRILARGGSLGLGPTTQAPDIRPGVYRITVEEIK